MMTGRKSGIMMRGRETETYVGGGLEPLAGTENVIDAAPALSGAVQSEAGLAYEALKVALKEYCFVLDSAFSELEDLVCAPGSERGGKVMEVQIDHSMDVQKEVANE